IPTKAFAGLGDGALNYAKIAANWTKVGRADIAPYATNRLFVSGTGYPFNGVGSFLQSTALTDPNIRPEFYTTTELAINLGFFNDRLTLEGAVYRSVNEDLITRATPSNTSGFTSAILNVGESVTDGFEVELGFTPIRNPGGLTWDNRISYTTFKT